MRELPLIDILVSVDTVALSTLLRDSRLAPGTVDHPTLLDAARQADALVTLTAQGCLVSNTDSEAVLRAASGGRLGWTISGFDSSADHTAYFYRGVFVFYPPKFATPRVEDLALATTATTVYLPPGSDPEAPPEPVTATTQRGDGPMVDAGEWFWAILEFAVVDNSHGQVLGYFRWIPRLRIESSVLGGRTEIA